MDGRKCGVHLDNYNFYQSFIKDQPRSLLESNQLLSQPTLAQKQHYHKTSFTYFPSRSQETATQTVRSENNFHGKDADDNDHGLDDKVLRKKSENSTFVYILKFKRVLVQNEVTVNAN